MLSTILPHLGGQSLDVVDEIANIKLEDSDNLNSLYLKFTTLKYKLEMSGHMIPATAMIQRYLNILMNIKQTRTHVAAIQRDFKDHLQMNGSDVIFPLSIEYVHDFLERSLIDMEEELAVIDNCNQSYVMSKSCKVTVIANAAVGLRQPDRKAPSPKTYQGRKSFG